VKVSFNVPLTWTLFLHFRLLTFPVARSPPSGDKGRAEGRRETLKMLKCGGVIPWLGSLGVLGYLIPPGSWCGYLKRGNNLDQMKGRLRLHSIPLLLLTYLLRKSI